MKHSRSIRFRLTLWYSTVLALSLTAFALTIWFALRSSLMSALDTRLSNRVAGVARFLQTEASTPDVALVTTEAREYASSLSNELSLRVWDYNGRLLLAWPASGPSGEDRGSGHVIRRGVMLGGKEYQIQMGTSLDDVESTLARLRTVLWACLPLVLALASGGGWWLSRRALTPVEAMTREAHDLSVANLSARLVVPDTGDELSHLAEAWNGVLDRLQAAVERLARFTADASHELRTPIALVRTTAELALRHDRSAAEYRQALAQVEQESLRMSALIEDLLLLARADAGSDKMRMAPVDLREPAQAGCAQIQAFARERQIRFSCRVSPKPLVVTGEPAALRRLVVLLSDNAIKYTPAGGAVEVWIGEHGSGALIEVRDTGSGIAADDLPHVFERFWRADKARTAGNGAGLGLALAQSIVQAHGGTLEVQSVLHQGSTFRALIPINVQAENTFPSVIS